MMNTDMDAKLKGYYNRIVQCLIRYGRLEKAEAQRLVDESGICEPQKEPGINMLFHETAYYWAMHLLYGREDPGSYWFHDPNLWPPPDDYYEWLKEQFKNDLES
jgi:hypothetical protein